VRSVRDKFEQTGTIFERFLPFVPKFLPFVHPLWIALPYFALDLSTLNIHHHD